MDKNSKEAFIEALETHYGRWEDNTSRFGNASFGRIAKELCISPSQFSKLIYGTATEGMYVRTIRNIERLALTKKLKAARDEKEEKLTTLAQVTDRQQTQINIYRLAIVALFFAIFGTAFWHFSTPRGPVESPMDKSMHPLTPYFDRQFNTNFHSPYLPASSVQDFCPCSAFEGRWSLEHPYKLPLPANRKPGIYYLARQADVRMKCFKSDTSSLGRGRVLIAFEYLTNEIWVDTRQKPLSPTYFNKETKSFTPEFDALEFETNDNFQRVATIYSFFIDRFLIYPDSIIRKGEPVGRYASDVNPDLVKDYEIDLKHVLDNVLGDLTQTDCESAPNPFCDPNDLSPGESVISFNCLYTISNENLGIGGGYPYRKSYKLEEQNYADNLTCNCTDY